MPTSTTREFLAVDSFLEQLRVVRQLSPHTLKAYQQDLNILCKNIQQEQLEIQLVSAIHIRSWVAKRHSEGLSPRSIARLLSAWRTFFDWLAIPRLDLGVKEIKTNPVQDIKAPRKAKSLPKALSVEYAIVLMEKAQAESRTYAQNPAAWVHVRDHALVELFYSSGLRLSEILGIDSNLSYGYPANSAGWIAWDSAEVHVLGKGDKRRIVPIGSAAMSALRVWFDVWSVMLQKREQFAGPIFMNDQLQRLSPRTVQARMKYLAMRAQLPVHVHPHMLRHSFASHVLQSSHDLRAVQEMLGHASIGSTQIYTSLDFQHLAQAYDLAHPRAKTK
jgi:integrase/recombinase XerC